QVSHVKKITVVADGNEQQQVEQCHGQDGAEIEAGKTVACLLVVIQTVTGKQRQRQLQRAGGLHAQQDIDTAVGRQPKREDQFVVVERAIFPPAHVAMLLVAEQFAVLVQQVKVEV